MYAVTHLQTIARRLKKGKYGATSTEFAYMGVFIVAIAALGAMLLGDDLGSFFYGFRITRDGISFN